MSSAVVRDALGGQLSDLLLRVGEEAKGLGFRASLVGGAVRDALLNVRSTDIDLVLEGDALGFAKILASRWSDIFPDLPKAGKPVLFPKYGTAKLIFEGDISPGVHGLDIAASRTESYSVSGAPPAILPGDVYADLFRRDFSINALAVSLDPSDRFAVIDRVGGQNDLAAGVLRILHPQSFVDDPARILRGLRFAARFGFWFDEETQSCFLEAVRERFLDRLARRRLFDELRKSLEERNVAVVLDAFDEFQILQQIDSNFVWRRVLKPEVFAQSSTDEIDPASIFSEFPPAWDEAESMTLSWYRKMRRLAGFLSDEDFESLLRSFGIRDRDIRTWQGE